jgi:hypothetical protein
MSEYHTLEEYAEHIRRETGRLSYEVFRTLGTEHPIAAKVCELCSEAAAIVTGAQMREEHAAVDNLDLSLLPKPYTGEA